jgi:hypothetical protein
MQTWQWRRLLGLPLDSVLGASLLAVIETNAALRTAAVLAFTRRYARTAACNALVRLASDEHVVERRISVAPSPSGDALRLNITRSPMTPERSADQPAQLDAIVDGSVMHCARLSTRR